MSQSILIVEDAPDLLGMYKLVFRAKPYGVQLAASGEEALKILEREAAIALVLLDLTLPGISGEELLAQVRSQRPAIKFLVMSGWDDLKQRAALMGAEAFARKPVLIPELEKQVEALLGG